VGASSGHDGAASAASISAASGLGSDMADTVVMCETQPDVMLGRLSGETLPYVKNASDR
jgi:hypothetical protein